MKKSRRSSNIPMLQPSLTAMDTRRVKPPSLIVTIEEDFFGLVGKMPNKQPAVMIYESDKIPDLVGCCNPRCRGGGLDLSPVVGRKGEHTFQCNGHQGGRLDGQRCDNHWNVTVSARERRLTR